METLNLLINISELILNYLSKKEELIDELTIKENLNNYLNEFKNLGTEKINIHNDLIDLLFDDCIKFLVQFNLINYDFQDGIRHFQINKIGDKILNSLEREYDDNQKVSARE